MFSACDRWGTCRGLLTLTITITLTLTLHAGDCFCDECYVYNEKQDALPAFKTFLGGHEDPEEEP